MQVNPEIIEILRKARAKAYATDGDYKDFACDMEDNIREYADDVVFAYEQTGQCSPEWLDDWIATMPDSYNCPRAFTEWLRQQPR